MHAELIKTKSILRELTKEAEAFERLITSETVTYPIGTGTSKRTAVAGEAFQLIYAILDTSKDLTETTTPKQSEFEKELDLDMMQKIEDYRTKKQTRLAAQVVKAIAQLRKPDFINAFKAASVFEQLLILEKVMNIVHVIDLYDPRTSVSAATSSRDHCFLLDADKGRPSIFDPLVLEIVVDALPIEHEADGTPKLRPGIVAPSFVGAATPSEALSFLVKLRTHLLSALTIATDSPAGRDAHARVLMKFFDGFMDGVSEIPAVRDAVTTSKKVDALLELTQKNGFRDVPASLMGRIKKGLSFGGIPFALVAGFMKILDAGKKLHVATKQSEAIKEAARLMGEATSFIASVGTIFGKKVAKNIAGKVSAFVALPMLIFELAAVHKGYTEALDNGDISVAFGQVVLGIAAVSSALFTTYLTFVVASTAGGPVGLAVSIGTGVILGLTLFGLYLVNFTKDADLIVFARRCAFGSEFNNSTADDPGKTSYNFGKATAVNCLPMIEKLYSLQCKLGFSATNKGGLAPGVYLLEHAAKDAQGNSVFPDGTLKMRHIGDGKPPLKTFTPTDLNEEEFRKGSAALLVENLPKAAKDWFRMELILSEGNPKGRIVEYALMPPSPLFDPERTG